MFTPVARQSLPHRVAFVRLSLLFVMLTLPALVAAQAPAPDFLRDFVYPRDGASPLDDIYVLYADSCGRPHPDPTRAADIQIVDGLVNVDIFLVEPELPVCIAVFLPDRLVATPIGRLARGTYDVRRRLHVREFGGSGHRLVLESFDSITVGHAPNPAVSGTWFDPLAPGAGVVVNRLPTATDEDADADAPTILFLATRLANGQAEWLSGLGSFVDGVLSVPLRRSTNAANGSADATAVFRYLGCSQSTLEVSGLDLEFPRGNATLQQLSGTAGVAGCRPPSVRPPDLD